MKPLMMVFLLFLAVPAASEPNPYLNLGFEAGVLGAQPSIWFAGGEGYTGVLSDEDPQEGSFCLSLVKTDPQKQGFGVATGNFPIKAARGNEIRYTGWIRTEGVDQGYAGLWWRVDGPEGMLAFDNMASRGVKGTTGWTQFVIELEVADEATNINFGCILPGAGKAWFDDLRVELDGVPYEQIRPKPFAADAAQVGWISETAHEFATDDPGHGNGDLDFLNDLVGDARIVSLGEGTHGTAEFFNMKHRITRYLVEEKGFTLFGIEASLPEAELINRYVETGEGDPTALIAGMYFWTWRTEEVLAMVEWMREHNAAGGHIEFHGIDMQFPGVAMKTVRDFVKANVPDMLVETLGSYAELRGLMKASEMIGDRSGALEGFDQEQVAAVRRGLEERREALVALHPPAEVDWVIRNAQVVEQFCEMSAGRNYRVRDRCMAENAAWWLDTAGPEAKIVLWAHNAHVARTGHNSMDMMGTHLDKRFGDQMVVLGFMFHEGTYTAVKKDEGNGTWGTSPSRPGTAEWAFKQTGKPRLVLDLRKAEAGSPESGWVFEELEHRSIGAMAMDEAFYPAKLSEQYDAVIYFETSTPSVLLEIEPPSQWAAWD